MSLSDPRPPGWSNSLVRDMREVLVWEMTRTVDSGTPKADSGGIASRRQVLTTELGDRTVIRKGSVRTRSGSSLCLSFQAFA